MEFHYMQLDGSYNLSFRWAVIKFNNTMGLFPHYGLQLGSLATLHNFIQKLIEVEPKKSKIQLGSIEEILWQPFVLQWLDNPNWVIVVCITITLIFHHVDLLGSNFENFFKWHCIVFCPMARFVTSVMCHDNILLKIMVLAFTMFVTSMQPSLLIWHLAKLHPQRSSLLVSSCNKLEVSSSSIGMTCWLKIDCT